MLTLVATTGWKCPQRFLAEYYFVVRKKGFISISYLLWHFPALGNTHCLFFVFFFVDAGFQKQVDQWIVTMILTVTRHFVAWIQSSFKPTSVNTEGHCVF